MLKEIYRPFQDFWAYVQLNGLCAGLILLVYLIANINIGLAEYPYIDDIGRQLQGYSGFSEHYSRYLNEFSARLIQGDRHLTDLGLTPHILSALILTLASLLVLFVFFPDKPIKIATAFSSTLLGLNPWFLEALSFRFDNPFMSLSLLVSILPFVYWHSKKLFLASSSLGIFLMCNSYQASSGLYILMTLTLFLLRFLDNVPLKKVLPKVILAVASYIIGMLAYKIQIVIKPPIFASQGKLPSLLSLPATVLHNFWAYISNIYQQSARIWIFLFAIILILTIIVLLIYSKRDKISSLLAIGLWLILGTIFSYGVYLIFLETFALLRPRYEYGFGIFVTIILVIGLQTSGTFFSKLHLGVAGLLTFYLLSFSFVYTSALKHENDIFKSQSIILGQSLNKYVAPEQPVVYVNRFLANSPIFENSASNYPLLRSLIMPNTNVSWDMTMRFNAITKLNLDFKLLTPEMGNVEDGTFTLLEKTKLYDIYQRDNETFVIMK